MARGRIAEDRSVEILNATRALVLELGPSRMTMEAVAARAGVGKGTVFLYWPSKARLLDALFNLELAEMIAAIAKKLERRADACRLSVILGHILAAQLAHPTISAFLHGGPIGLSRDDSALAQALRRILLVLRGHDLLKPVPDEEIALGIEAVIFGLLKIHVEGRSPPDGTDIPAMFERIVATTYEVNTPPAASLQRAVVETGQILDTLIEALIERAAPDRNASLPPRHRLGRASAPR
jgi:AcrR family transcriptional regulator